GGIMIIHYPSASFYSVIIDRRIVGVAGPRNPKGISGIKSREISDFHGKPLGSGNRVVGDNRF
ncbi:MAG: hypothetical protein JW827_02355, partial [Spirochaetes bacterium]|nr:hypothetical protein [Spirochaetota bacterium]